MPLCTLHLVALNPTNPNFHVRFLSALKFANVQPLVVSRVIRWIVLPSTISTEHLLARNIHWDFLLILLGESNLPTNLHSHIQDTWSITAGVPSRLTQDFARKNSTLLRPPTGSVPSVSDTVLSPKQTTSSSQNLELSSDLFDWIRSFANAGSPESIGAVSMFNLLSFRPSKKALYLEYGKAFASSVGSSHGGNAKIVGGVTRTNGVPRPKDVEDGEGWDEVALAHYPSILHFAEMLADEKYQAVNQQWRVPSLRDTCILMTSEIGVDGWQRDGARL